MIRGRCIQVTTTGVVLCNLEGEHAIACTAGEARAGDIIEAAPGGAAKVLTRNRAGRATSIWTERVLSPRRRRAIGVRQGVESAIREFFLGQGFLETRTPLLVPCPGMEPHIRPFDVSRHSAGREGVAYLPTSPEFAMKRLLVGGLEKIFQLCPAFRDEAESVTHHPEFTILEWYRAYTGYEDIMRDTEELFAFAARKLFGRETLVYQGREISVATPWSRLRVRDLFQELAGVDLVANPEASDLARECARLGLKCDLSRESWDDLYFKIWLNRIEPALPADRAVFVTRYPASQAALSVIDRDPDGSRWARRFEAYAGGLELANAFEELTDPDEQRARFVADMKYREETYGADHPANPIDEGFIDALREGMPPSGGIALGVDRMVMLFADEPELDQTLWLRSGSQA